MIILCEASISDKVGALVEWIKHHVSPVPSFEWHPLGFIDLGKLPSWLSVQALMMIFVTIIILVIFGVLYRTKGGLAPQGFVAKFFEPFILFIRNEIAIDNLGEKDGRKWTPFFCTLFFFILGCNLIGLIPGNVTPTGTPFVTAGLALIIFLCMTVGTIIKFGPSRFIKAFIPEGVPVVLLILLTPLEMLGVVIKAVALTIRLFANMFAGHIVLFSLMGMTYAFGVWGLPSIIMSWGVSALEIFVAFLQSYIFTFLSAMFIGDIFHHAKGHDDEYAH